MRLNQLLGTITEMVALASIPVVVAGLVWIYTIV